MKKSIVIILCLLFSSTVYAIPPGKNWKSCSDADITAGTSTTPCVNTPKQLGDTYSGAAAEVSDATVSIAGNGDTTKAYSKDDIHDYVVQHDSDYDGLPDAVESSSITDAMLNLTTPNLSTPSSVVLTNATGLPVATGISGLAAGIATFLATPTIANLNTAVSDASLYSQTQIDNALALKVALGTDPDVDVIYFWDDSAGAEGQLTIGSGLSITGTTLAATATAPKLNDLTAADDNTVIDNASYEFTLSSTTDGWGGYILHSDVVDNAVDTVLLTLQADDADDANTIYMRVIEDIDGTPVTLFEISRRAFTLGTGASIEGLGSLSLGGIILGDTTPDAAGEIGYASNAFLGFANSEDFTLTASANLWTFASNTAAAFAFTPAVTLTGGITSIGAASDLSGGTVTLGAVAGAIDAGGATSLEIPNSDASPSVTGQIRLDTTVTNYANGALRFYDGTNIRHVISMVAATAEGCTDDQVAAYDAVANLWYCKDDAGAAGGDSVSIDSVAVVDPDFVSTGDIDFTDTSNTITADINPGVIIEPDLDADNAPSDGDVLTYDSTGTNFAWITPNAGTDITADLEEEVSAGSLADNSVYSADINTIVDSIFWDSGGMVPDGTNCAVSTTAVQINSGPLQYTAICTDNDASTLYGHVVMPDSWDGGTVTAELEYLQTAADTSALNSDITMQCRGATETVNSTWGTEIAIDDAAVTGSNAVDHTTSAAITPNGTCAGGDTLYWRWQLDATGTTTAVATLHILGLKVEYTSNVGD